MKINNIPVKRVNNILNTLFTQIETELDENGRVSLVNLEAFKLFSNYKNLIDKDTEN